MKYIVAFFALALLTSCSTTNQFLVADYDKNPQQKLPSVTVFLNRPSKAFREDCEGFDRQSALHHCLLNRLNLAKFSNEIEESGLFDTVAYADQNVEYRLLLSTGSYNLEGGDDLGSAVLAGATLLVAPLVISTNIKVEADLYWYEYPLKRFEYNLPIELRTSLLSLNQDTEGDIAKSVASHILRDIQSEDLFSPTYLASILQSSDYKHSLTAPTKSGNYERLDTFIFNHPLQGAMVRYLEDAYPSDHIDVFVYPIRAPHWRSRSEEAMNQEIINTQREIAAFNTENNIEPTRKEYKRTIPLSRNGETFDAVNFGNEYQDSLFNEYTSQTYLMIIGDKFVKVRHSALKGGISQLELDKFVQQIASQIDVPEESQFMSKLRKHWLETETL